MRVWGFFLLQITSGTDIAALAESHCWEPTISDHYPVLKLALSTLFENSASSEAESGISCVLDDLGDSEW